MPDSILPPVRGCKLRLVWDRDRPPPDPLVQSILNYLDVLDRLALPRDPNKAS